MEHFHLTTPQQNIWNLQKYYSGTAIANLCGAIFFREKREDVLLCRSVSRFIHSQSGIRLRFNEEGEVPRQYVSEETDEDIPVRTFRSMEEFDVYAENCAKAPIGLSEGKMYRFLVFHLEQEDRSGILVVLSHLIADAWTYGLMANQLDAAYRQLAGEGEWNTSGVCAASAEAKHKQASLLEGDYREFIRSEDAYFASERYEKDKSYWNEKYPARPEESPVRLRLASADSVEAARITRTLPAALERSIAAYCGSHPVTEAVLFETALVVYLSRINPESRAVTLGVPVLNRANAREREIAGMFVSTMPLTAAVAEDMEIGELAGQITKGHMDLFRHQKYPFGSILRQLREKQDFSGNLFDVMVSYQNAKTKTGADTKWYSNGCSEVPLVVHIDNRDGKECHTLNVDYQTAVFRDREEVELLINRLEYILEQIVAGGVERVGEVGIVPPEEYERVVYEFNDTYVEYPREKCVHELFLEQVARTPERTALVFEDRKFTYRELDEMSNSLAHFLREKGIGRGDIVPIIAQRSWHVIVAMLGILKAGGAYMLIDYQYPDDRISYLVNECKADIVLGYGCEYANAIDLKNINFSQDTNRVESINEMSDILCVIHTSGSTGVPKVTALSHENIAHYIDYAERLFRGTRQTIATTTITFDAFIQETLVSLCRQVSVILLSEEQITNQNEFEKVVEKYANSFLFQTPTKLQGYIRNSKTKKFLSQIASFVIGGEVFPQELYDALRRYNPNGRIYNAYGPTETTMCVVVNELEDGADITIGTPIANIQIYILGCDQRPVPIGVHGELCIAGEGVGLGYLNRPEMTAERFVSNPFATVESHHGKIMYRTGDHARFLMDGEIEYLGRMDTQVKIRGMRIELGEIESVMGSFPGIGLCVVADKKDEVGRQYLVGYYTVGQDAFCNLDEKALRAHLSAKLPKYMVPNYFRRLDAMPMTASGKTDRKNLPVPDFTQQAEEYVPPETDAEKRLGEVWQELLHMEKVGRTDDFFELGGDSLLAISMLNEVEKRFHVEISVREIIEHSELAALARCLEESCVAEGITGTGSDAAENPAVRRITAHHADRYPLLPQQKAIYAACMKEPDTLVYNMPAKIVLPDTVDRDRLKESIVQVLDRYKLMKSCVRMEETGLYGIYERDAMIVFEEYEAGQEEAFVRPFDLEKAPLVRVGFTADALLFDMHHIIMDGTSLNILLGEIAAVYEGSRLPEQGTEYPDYAEYFYGLDMGEHKAYFREALKCEWEPVALPETRKPGTGGESRIYQIPGEVFVRARDYARRNGLTDTMVFLGAYGILLSKYTGRKEVLSSIILQNRTHGDIRDMVGMFVNTLPVCLVLEKENVPESDYTLKGSNMLMEGDESKSRYTENSCNPEGSVVTYMREVKEKLLGLFRYQELPFEDIAETAGMENRSAVNTSFVYQGDGEKALCLEGQRLVPEFLDTHTAKFDLTMELIPVGDGCRMRLEYNLAKYDGELVDALAEGYIRILGQLDKEKLADISVLSEQEYCRIVEEFNDTYVEYPREKCIHELFEQMAALHPEKTALVDGNKKYTYQELDEKSNALAQKLIMCGIQEGKAVGAYLDRTAYVVISQLAVLKASGIFLPIDRRYPKDRIEYMLKDCNVSLVISDEELGKEWDVPYINLKSYDFGDVLVKQVKSRPEAPCYIIYTSGSTGNPKGCVLKHAGIANFCANNNIISYVEKLEHQTVVSVNTISFDFFIAETLLPLAHGWTVVLASEEESSNKKQFKKLLIENNINIIETTPTRLEIYTKDENKDSYFHQIQLIVTSGEALSESLLEHLKIVSNAKIYNPLGPSECSVWNVDGNFKADITIGTPIANTQIYILDGDQRPVPIGVPGELCIAGAGVGLGYLNRPELTAERFVPNPFATAENRYGKTMYRTGDLARFRRDGEIEYLGRMDTQVKIRGLRIELGEIESVMGSFPGIGLCAVADKRDETGRQYLVGYYTVAADACSRKEESATAGWGRWQDRIEDNGAQCQGGRESDAGTGIGALQKVSVSLDEKALRAHLCAKLPKYMVPNYFLRLDAMPMTVSGKTDRKNLPVPDFTQSAKEYIPPETEREKELCRLIGELLHVEQVGVTDDFFELGGDSLTAIEFLAKAQDRGISFALQNIFDYPTVRQLCDHMDAGSEEKIHFEPADFDKYRELLAENVIDEAHAPERKNGGKNFQRNFPQGNSTSGFSTLGNVLLTGATGFLGAHVLDRLMQEETGRIYCLVRDRKKVGNEAENGEKADGSGRLRKILRYYFGDRYEGEFTEGLEEEAASATGIKAERETQAGGEPGQKSTRRIIPIAGDIECPTLAADMPKDVQTVIHTAASVKHYGSYEYFHRVNVEGARHVVNYAKSVGARLIHISTLSVSGNSLADEFAVYRSEEEKFFDETSFYIGQPLDNVYIHSKFEAERAVFDAMLEGLDAKIIRVGNLTSRASDYRFQPNYRENAFLTRFRAILEFGLFPDYLMPLYSEFSPVDLTAEGIVKIAQYADRQTVFHLNSNRPIYFERFLEVVHELGIPMEVVDGDTFNRALRGTIRNRVTEYIFEAFQNDMDEQGRLVYDSNIHIENDFTVWFLKRLGFEWNEIDLEYIRGYVEYFRGIGYLEI